MSTLELSTTISPPSYIQVQEKSTKEVEVFLSPILEEIKSGQGLELTSGQREGFDKYFGEDVQAIRIFAGGTQKYTTLSGESYWRSPDFNGVDNNGLSTGALFRVAASAIALDVYPNAQVIVGSRYADNVLPPPSIVMKEELVMTGIDERRIYSDPDTLDTIAEVLRFIEIAQIQGWDHIACVSSDFHMPRLNAILANLEWLVLPGELTNDLQRGVERFRNGELEVKIVPAEKVIELYSDQIYTKYVAPQLLHPNLPTRIASEIEGAVSMNSGVYNRLDPSTNQRVALSRSNLLV